MKEPKKDSYLTPDEVAERMRITRGTLANWRSRGKGPKFIRFGQRILYSEQQISRFIEECVNEKTQYEEV
jgi:excisionase family DNA binding protein